MSNRQGNTPTGQSTQTNQSEIAGRSTDQKDSKVNTNKMGNQPGRNAGQGSSSQQGSPQRQDKKMDSGGSCGCGSTDSNL
jgi:hypothetical protein